MAIDTFIVMLMDLQSGLLVRRAAPQTAAEQEAALLAFKTGGNGAGLESWDAATEPCAAGWNSQSLGWVGVQCDAENGNVERLNLCCDKTGLTGLLGALAPLTTLTYLSLSRTRVSGDVAGLAALTQLRFLGLLHTDAAGDVAGLATLIQLTELALTHTDVGGDVSGLAPLTQLTDLFLDETNAAGDVAGLAPLILLEKLRVSGTLVYGDAAALRATLTSLDNEWDPDGTGFTACTGFECPLLTELVADTSNTVGGEACSCCTPPTDRHRDGAQICTENVCAAFSAMPAGYSIANLGATTVPALGAISCASGYHGAAATACTGNGSFAAPSGCDACEAVADSVTVSCVGPSNTRASCAAGYYHTDNSGRATSDSCTACSSQPGCLVDSPACLSTGDTSVLGCSVPEAGYYLVGSGNESTTAACGSQVGCSADTAATCLATGDGTKLACSAPAPGYHLVGSGNASRATACTSQDGCWADARLTCLGVGDTTKLACIAATAGFFIAGSRENRTVDVCEAVDNAATVTCEASGNSRAVCAEGFYLEDNSDLEISDFCSDTAPIEELAVLLAAAVLGGVGCVCCVSFIEWRRRRSKEYPLVKLDSELFAHKGNFNFSKQKGSHSASILRSMLNLKVMIEYYNAHARSHIEDAMTPEKAQRYLTSKSWVKKENTTLEMRTYQVPNSNEEGDAAAYSGGFLIGYFDGRHDRVTYVPLHKNGCAPLPSVSAKTGPGIPGDWQLNVDALEATAKVLDGLYADLAKGVSSLMMTLQANAGGNSWEAEGADFFKEVGGRELHDAIQAALGGVERTEKQLEFYIKKRLTSSDAPLPASPDEVMMDHIDKVVDKVRNLDFHEQRFKHYADGVKFIKTVQGIGRKILDANPHAKQFGTLELQVDGDTILSTLADTIGDTVDLGLGTLDVFDTAVDTVVDTVDTVGHTVVDTVDTVGHAVVDTAVDTFDSAVDTAFGTEWAEDKTKSRR